jgi:hypothetical protein
MGALTRRQLLAAGLLAGLAGPRRAEAAPRLPAVDLGPVLRHGAPEDVNGAREMIVYRNPALPSRLYAYYDGCAPDGWIACRAWSDTGGRSWIKRGRVLQLGPPGSRWAASASSPWLRRRDDGGWAMYYLGTPTATAPPSSIPSGRYTTNLAVAASHIGPWDQLADPVPFSPLPGTWYSATASPGPVLRPAAGGPWLMYFSGSSAAGRSIGLATTTDLLGTWTVQPDPLLPPSEQLENAAVYRDTRTGLWWLLANHIHRTATTGPYTNAVWGYWSASPTSFSPGRRAVVLDATVCRWTRVIGMPSVTRLSSSRLAVFYDGRADHQPGHLRRDIALALLPLPLRPV